MKKIKFLDVEGATHSIIAADVEQFSHDINHETGQQCTRVEIGGKTIMADCHLLNFTAAWNSAISVRDDEIMIGHM